MADYYTQQETVPLEYDCPTSCVKHYTPLTIFCYKKEYTKLEATAVARMFTLTEIITHERNSSIHMHGKVTENINDLFTMNSPYVIVIEGTAGIGKTTLCKEIAIQWAKKYILVNKTLLFLLFMHDPEIENLRNVKLLVKHFFQSEILGNKITDWLEATNGEYLTIIIDGYSENCGNRFITDDLIGRKKLTCCNLVMTSRSPTLLHHCKTINHRALILGFIKSNQITFIDNTLKGSSSSKIDYLKKYLQSNPIIDSLCNIPLIMSMLFQFVEERKGDMSKSQTSLIQKYFMTIIKKKTITNLTELPHPYDQVIKVLSQFAYITLQENQLTFTLDEILKLYDNHFQVYWHGLDFLNNLHELGLLNEIPFRAQGFDCKMFHFIHITIREYLAAYYISSLPDSQLSKLFHSTFCDAHYFNTWVIYAGITRGKSGYQLFKKSSTTMKLPTDKVAYYHYQLLHYLKEADGDLDNGLMEQDIYLKCQQLSYDDLHTLTKLLTRSPNKHWDCLNLSQCSIDDQGCNILSEMFRLCTKLKFETVDISNNDFHWESFYNICTTLNGYTKNLVFSINSLYDTVTMNEINKFTAMLEEKFQEKIPSDEILSLAYLAKQKKLIAVYSAPDLIRWFQWVDCKLNRKMIKDIKYFIENKVGKRTFQIVFNYSFIDYYGKIENLLTLLSNIQHIHLCGSYLLTKGAYSLNIACTIDCQYNSPQKLIADYLAAVLCHNTQSKMLYLESLSAANATLVKSLLQSTLAINVLDISYNSINNQIAKEIAIILSFTSTLRKFYVINSNLLDENIVTITKNLQNISTLTEFDISNNNVGKEAADDIAKVLSNNTQLQKLNIGYNSFNTEGMSKIAKGLRNVSTLTKFAISSNNVGKEEADYIAEVLSHNTNLQQLYLGNNNFETRAMINIVRSLENVSTLLAFSIFNNDVGEAAACHIAKFLSNNKQLQILNIGYNSLNSEGVAKIASVLQNVSTLTIFAISKNNVNEKAAEAIATVLSHNTNLQKLFLSKNSFKTVGMNKIAKALQNISTLTTFAINNNSVGEGAADSIAKVLSNSTNLQQLYLGNNSFNAKGMNKIAEALQNVSTLTMFDIGNNNIDKEAADNIAKVLSNNTKLEKLNFSNNHFKAVDMIQIAKTLENIRTLTMLNISNNSIGKEATNDIIADLAATLSKSVVLRKLNVSQNSLKFVNVVTFAHYFRHHPTLQTFNLINNATDSFSPAYELIVDVILSVNPVLINLNVCGRNIRPRDVKDYLPPSNIYTKFTLEIFYSLQPSSSDITDGQTIIKVTEICPMLCQDITSYYVDHLGGVFYNQCHNYAIVVPPGAVSQGECVEIQSNTSCFSPYIIPDGFYPISSYYWISANYEFKIPVYFIMNHYAKIRNLEDISNLHVLQACVDSSNGGIENVTMNPISNGVYFDYDIGHCVVATNHFCCYCQAKSVQDIPEYLLACYYTYDEPSSGSFIAEVCFCPSNTDFKKVAMYSKLKQVDICYLTF